MCVAFRSSAVSLIAILALPGWMQGAHTQGDVSRAELEDLEAQRDEALRQLAAIEEAGSSVAGDLESLERDLIAAALESQRREEQATTAELELISLRTRLSAARSDLVSGEDALEDLIASLAVSGRHRPPALLTQPSDANQAIRAAILMGEVAPQVQRKTSHINQEIANLRQLENQVLREQKVLAAADASLALKREEIMQMTMAKRAAFEDVTANAQALRDRAESLANQADTVRELIAALEAAAPVAPRLKPRLAFAEMSRPQSTRSASLPRPTVSQPIGALSAPTMGRMVRAWGDRLPGGVKSESVAFATRNGAQVSAPISGKVEFSGPFRSYGQLLILSTSDGYHVLLWGMSSSYVSVGQSVQQGEPVARMADRGAGEKELFMEVRKAGEPMDPANWMKRG